MNRHSPDGASGSWLRVDRSYRLGKTVATGDCVLNGPEVPNMPRWITILVWDRSRFLQVATDSLNHSVRAECRLCGAPGMRSYGAPSP